MKKFMIVLVAIITAFTIPISVFAADYNVTDESDRNTVTTMIPGTTFDSNDNYRPSIGVTTTIKSGDTIYFENTNNWTEVKIYLFESGTNDVPSGEVWPGYDMTNTNDQVNGHDVFSYTYNDSLEKFNSIVFSGLDSSSNRKQTIDYSYLGNGLYLSCSSEANGEGKYYGGWYVYDKSILEHYIELLEDLANIEDYIDPTSYADLTNLIDDANDVMQETNTAITYYDYPNTLHVSEYTELLYDIATALNNMVLNSSSLEDVIDEASALDTTNLDDSKVDELEDLLNDANNLNNLMSSGNPFNLTTNSTINEIDSQNSELYDAIDVMNDLIDDLNAIIDEVNNQSNNSGTNNNNNNNTSNDNTNTNTSNTNNITNPNTADSILVYIIMLITSIVGFGTIIVFNHKQQNI